MPDSPSTSPADILVVDDTPANLRLLSDMLQDQGYHVRKAINGKMALLAVQSKVPDLIFLDINMPDLNGYEVCHKLKEDEQTSQAPVIFISALNDALDKVKAFQMGGEDYITKPFAIEEVLARTEHQLKLQRLNRELRDRNQELQNTVQQLKVTQAQLIHEEKMSSLTSLIAGIAHEINNPTSFIHGNLEPIQTYSDDLLQLLAAYEQCYPEPDPEVEELRQELDIEFVRDDLGKAVASVQMGTQRIRSIVQSLRTFSHLDESDVKAVDIHEGIDSTLLILQNRFQESGEHPTINIIKKYGELPDIDCYPSQLNQVFLHLIKNGIDAFKGKSAEATPRIEVTTKKLASNQVEITISDNGCGIDPKIHEQVFDPFFTTKPTGEGTGLGLYVSYQIITDRHHGTLNFTSERDRGTTFKIVIPTRQEGNT